MNLLTRFKTFGKSRKGGALTLLLSILATLIWVQFPGGSLIKTGGELTGGLTGQVSVHPGTGVKLQASLSQPMIVQGSDGAVYLDLTVVTPQGSDRKLRRVPTDTIVILDRSGSMGEQNKWRYATQAVNSLLDRLMRDDRIALITFDSRAHIQSPLVRATEENTIRIRNVVARLTPGASTNLGEALLLAEDIAKASALSERGRRLILLSDGHANAGIVHPRELGALARRIADGGSILSTIGMGLGFNETLMASLADQGMGSFSYLEHLESLASVLAKELADSRDIYAKGSEIRIHLPTGVELVDAAGYPFVLEGRTAVIRTGQLFQDSQKQFMATLKVTSQTPAEYTLGTIDLRYQVKNRSFRQQIESDRLIIACVPPERKEEVVASIDKDLYREAWIRNNFGSVMRKVGDLVRTGEEEKARELMKSYRGRLEEADQAVPGLKNQADSQLEKLEARVDDAFHGRDQKVKQNRAAKALLGDSQQLQRKTNKKTN